MSSRKKTPLIKQYESIKAHHPQELLLFRMGDFYELFHEDARVAAKELNITLTKRNKKSGDDTDMCGFPHHSMEGPINKLLEAGHKVAVCEQLEEPSQAKGLVKRGVTLRLSPGVVFHPDQLDQDSHHYLMAASLTECAWFDPSTGQAFYQELGSFFKELLQLILKLKPQELILDEGLEFEPVTTVLMEQLNFGELSPRKFLLKHVESMQGPQALFGFTQWQKTEPQRQLKLSLPFFRHMEVFESSEGDKSKSLFATLKKTQTPGGTRLLKSWLEHPLIEKEKIEYRQLETKKWEGKFEELSSFRKALTHVGDLERRVARAGHSLGAPQDLVRLKKSMEVALYALEGHSSLDHKKLAGLLECLDKALEEEVVSQWQNKGGYLKKGFDSNLDELIKASTGAQAEVEALEKKERQLTGISTLKIRFNNVFGFYIEVTKVHKDKVPENRYVRKQTLTQAERYTTSDLSELEEKVLSAKTKKVLLEKELFLQLKDRVRSHLKELKALSEVCAQEDVFSAMAFLCVEKGLSLPEINKECVLEIKGGFHPVVAEDLLKKGQTSFIKNDFKLSQKESFYLITGPNMAGKSTLMRQVALISYLAQCGVPVPAEQARVPIYKSLFTRIGASDVLSEGLSTFMVEMTETAEILKAAGPESLLILDEIGRGTSNHDGLALAQSIGSYILTKLKSHTLFATHYHELTTRWEEPCFQNIHMGYVEKEGEIQFTYKVKKGASLNSYGIEVARLAGLPSPVIKKAEANKSTAETGSSKQMVFSFEPSLNEEFIQALKAANLNKMTPLEALNKIAKWQENFL